MSSTKNSSAPSESQQREPKQKQYQAREPKGDVQNKSSYRTDRNHRQSNYRSDRDQNVNDNSRDRKNFDNNRDRYNPPKYRDSRGHPGNRRNNNSRPKYADKKVEDKRNSQDTKLKEVTQGTPEDIPLKEKLVITDKTVKAQDNAISSNGPVVNQPTTQEAKARPSHGHYHHKNSNKPRFAKIFSENGKDIMNKSSTSDEKMEDKVKENGPCLDADSTDSKAVMETGKPLKLNGTSVKDTDTGSKTANMDGVKEDAKEAPLIDQLKVISQQLNSAPQGEDVFAKLKSGEAVELDNLKQLYDKIPDITKTEIIKETEEWATSLPTTETVLQDSNRISCDMSCDETRTFPCCPHGNCCPPFFHHGFMPPALPHPAYYYAALWNYHHPVPPPPVQRLANAPSLPSPNDNAAVHKRYITRSTKTPGSIVFTLHVSDNLRIVSVRSEDPFSMTADLCNEEGEKIAENFALHSEAAPKLWEQYAFSGNHTLHFNIDAPSPTVVVVTFLHEIPLK